jgi:hypothetical protein
MKDGVDVHVEGPVPDFLGDLEQAARSRVDGAVHEHVHPAQGDRRLLDPGGRLPRVAEISGRGVALPTEGFDLRLHRAGGLVNAQANDSDVTSVPRQFQRRRSADSAGSPSDRTRLVQDVHRWSLV